MYESLHTQEVTNGASWSFNKCWEYAVQRYGIPLLQYCISNLYSVYSYCTPINVVLFLVKTVPTGVYVFNLVKSIYITSRERLYLKQIELDELKLQVHIVNTKLSVRDGEFTERALELRRSMEELRKMRARVREVIAADEELKRSLHVTGPWGEESDMDIDANAPPEEHEIIVQLLKELEYDPVEAGVAADGPASDSSRSTPADSVYFSARDADMKPNCHVKIVKVTNVYKVAYLKHYIKRKRLRRATRHALLKKKMESVKKLFDDWHKTLSMVINSNSVFNMDSQYVDIASQEAMGDYTKPDFRESSDSDSDTKYFNDNYWEQPGLYWPRNSYRNFKSNFEEAPDAAVSKDLSAPPYQRDRFDRLQYGARISNVLEVLPEEAGSQLTVEEVTSDAVEDARSVASAEYECRDNGSM